VYMSIIPKKKKFHLLTELVPHSPPPLFCSTSRSRSLLSTLCRGSRLSVSVFRFCHTTPQHNASHRNIQPTFAHRRTILLSPPPLIFYAFASLINQPTKEKEHKEKQTKTKGVAKTNAKERTYIWQGILWAQRHNLVVSVVQYVMALPR
jgi:hypothetical protein